MKIEEANKLIDEYVSLRNKLALDKDNQELAEKLDQQEKLCLNKFKYIVYGKTSRYKHFFNYDDLNQEGMQALLRAMNSYIPGKGNWFWWASKYVSTKISRSANLHTTIKYPLKFAKGTPPRREAVLPLLIDERTPEMNLEEMQLYREVILAMDYLNETEEKVIQMFFGIDGEQEQSISKICKNLHISYGSAVDALNRGVSILRNRAEI